MNVGLHPEIQYNKIIIRKDNKKKDQSVLNPLRVISILKAVPLLKVINDPERR